MKKPCEECVFTTVVTGESGGSNKFVSLLSFDSAAGIYLQTAQEKEKVKFTSLADKLIRQRRLGM